MAGENFVMPEEIESSELIPVCAHCGAEIMRVVFDQTTTSAGEPLRYQIVSGTFIQALDGEGREIGPRWGFCLACVEAERTTLPEQYLEEGVLQCLS